MGRKDSHHHGKFFLGAMIGAAIGAITALLTAPKSGRETRKDIKDKAGEISDDARRQLRKLEGELSKHISDAKKNAQKAQGEARRRLETTIKRAEDYKEKVMGSLDEIQKHTQKKIDDRFMQDVKDTLKELQTLRDEIEAERKKK